MEDDLGIESISLDTLKDRYDQEIKSLESSAVLDMGVHRSPRSIKAAGTCSATVSNSADVQLLQRISAVDFILPANFPSPLPRPLRHLKLSPRPLKHQVVSIHLVEPGSSRAPPPLAVSSLCHSQTALLSHTRSLSLTHSCCIHVARPRNLSSRLSRCVRQSRRDLDTSLSKKIDQKFNVFRTELMEEKQRRMDSARRYRNFSTCSLLL